MQRDWVLRGRMDQLPPDLTHYDEDWTVWLLMGGRGAGKTRAGAEWIKAQVKGDLCFSPAPARRIALVGQTLNDVRSVMVEGESGLLAVHDRRSRPVYEPSKRTVTWANGAVAQLFSAEEPDQLRGPQFETAWCDEIAKWRNPDETWDMLQFALRLGPKPRIVATTTPKPVPILHKLLAETGTRVSRAKTRDNAANLAASFLAVVEGKYGGTALGRQELDGELIDDDPRALFKRADIEKYRVAAAPELARIVVAVDPPATAGTGANACGIICAGLGGDGRGYVLRDGTLEGAAPARWAKRAVELFHAYEADRLIAEVNQGGDMVEAVIREIDPRIPFRAVRASRGKQTRAEPIAALYEQGRISHVGVFAELEDELCSLEAVIASAGRSPDRADALVWAMTELMLGRPKAPRVRSL
ncbi:DNA-packaging protein [Rhodoligotrophos ferricapiens]|uniref:DNA-packaging protein n=1 Tax=Rhodoligotrophos ferricapiens TaxID=3069264 RepID=UPI00315D1954